MGGKSKLREQIIAKFPPHSTYVEVCGGAGWVLFGKNPSPAEVYNDINGELVNFYRICKTRPDELIQALDLLPSSREIFQGWKDVDLLALDEVTRAARMYYLIWLCFAGKFSGTRPASNFAYTMGKPPRFDPDKVPDAIRRTHERFKHVYVENLDCVELIKQYDSPESLFFVDPPYAGLTGYGGDGFNDADQRRLAEALRGIKGRFLLTNSDHPLIRELYDGCNFEEVEVLYTIGANLDENGVAERNNKRVTELIVTNFQPQPTLFDGLGGW